MQTTELQNKIIRKVLATDDISLLEKIQDFLNSLKEKKTYKLSPSERKIIEEREIHYKTEKKISNEDVFKEIEEML